MISIIQLALDHHAAGRIDACQQTLDGISAGGRWQVELRFDQVATICQHRIEARQEPCPGNRLCIEHVMPAPRCLRQSPDGRGAAWLMSGGDGAAYGPCQLATCPLGTYQGEG